MVKFLKQHSIFALNLRTYSMETAMI